MNTTSRWRCVAGLAGMVLAATCVGQAPAQPAAASFPLIDFAAADAAARIQPEEGKGVTAAIAGGANGTGLGVTVVGNSPDYPGVAILPPTGAWDLSRFGHVEARIANTDSAPLTVSLRIDNDGDWKDDPFNTESLSIAPGAAGVVRTYFGRQYGFQPGYKLDPAKVVRVMLFTGKSAQPQSFRVESIVAAGAPGEHPPTNPQDLRTRPPGGVILGPGVMIDLGQVQVTGGKAAIEPDGLTLGFTAAGAEPRAAAIRPVDGRWDLGLANRLRISVLNAGDAASIPTLQIHSSAGASRLVRAAEPIPPGGRGELIVPFAPETPWKAGPMSPEGKIEALPGTGTRFESCNVASIVVGETADATTSLKVVEIVADAPPATLPDWLGKRPPVEGDWVTTLDENFDAASINDKVWNIYGPNYWDRRSHWSKDNLIIQDGVAIQRFERKRGPHNDGNNPEGLKNLTGQLESDYACGYLDTYGKWTQRYGYYEARVKLPRVPGLWPTFWMMPDRGEKAGDQWKRSDTGDGAMELDIMEHLTRWGPYRHNIAWHWDGYGKEHKAVGTSSVYVQHDADGYFTAGMLWLPGVIVYYTNGVETARFEGDRVSTVPSHFIFETTTGGWDNDAVDDAALPADYAIDYVRVWQRRDLSSEADTAFPLR